jgi:hypothetical protein
MKIQNIIFVNQKKLLLRTKMLSLDSLRLNQI